MESPNKPHAIECLNVDDALRHVEDALVMGDQAKISQERTQLAAALEILEHVSPEKYSQYANRPMVIENLKWLASK